MKNQRKKRSIEDSDEESSNESSDADVESVSDESLSDSEVDEPVDKKKSAKKKLSVKEDTFKETKNNVLTAPKLVLWCSPISKTWQNDSKDWSCSLLSMVIMRPRLQYFDPYTV